MTATYTRDPVPADRTGQCPCCLRQHRASGRANSLQRHGWRETGRRAGEHGRGFQFGACIGSGMRPLEQTDADAQTVLARLAAHITDVRADLALHEGKGADRYSYEFTLSAWDKDRQDTMVAQATRALNTAGLTFTMRSSLDRRGRDDGTTFTVVVPRGHGTLKLTDERTMTAWTDLRVAMAREVRGVLKALVEQQAAIRAAVAHHAANPSQGGEDSVRRGPAVHLERTFVRSPERCAPGATLEQRTSTVLGCGAKRWSARATTTDETKVTCTRCLKDIADRAASHPKTTMVAGVPPKGKKTAEHRCPACNDTISRPVGDAYTCRGAGTKKNRDWGF